MANTKIDTWKTEPIIRHGYIEYPLPEGIKRRITSGKWGTPMSSGRTDIITKPASKKKR